MTCQKQLNCLSQKYCNFQTFLNDIKTFQFVKYQQWHYNTLETLVHYIIINYLKWTVLNQGSMLHIEWWWHDDVQTPSVLIIFNGHNTYLQWLKYLVLGQNSTSHSLMLLAETGAATHTCCDTFWSDSLSVVYKANKTHILTVKTSYTIYALYLLMVSHHASNNALTTLGDWHNLIITYHSLTAVRYVTTESRSISTMSNHMPITTFLQLCSPGLKKLAVAMICMHVLAIISSSVSDEVLVQCQHCARLQYVLVCIVYLV